MTWLLLGPISNNMPYGTLHMQSACDSCKKKNECTNWHVKRLARDMHADWIMQKSKTLQSTNFIKIGLPLSRDWGKSFTREQSINKGTNLLV